MRWTYTFLIATYLLLTAHSTAQPVSSAVQHADTVQLSRREPFPGRQKRQRSSSPVASGSRSAKRQKSRSRSNSESSVGPPSSASIDSPGPPSPKKQRRSRHPASNIRTVDLKSDDYRKQAIEKEPPRSDWQGFDADHILEPQTVTYYLNNHRGSGVVDKKCIKALKVHLNHKSNLKMLDKDSNQNKNHVVAALNEHADPAQFNPKVKKHIVDHDRDILRTAAAIDNEFNGKGGCAKYRKPTKGGGIKAAAQRMINHARKP